MTYAVFQKKNTNTVKVQ